MRIYYFDVILWDLDELPETEELCKQCLEKEWCKLYTPEEFERDYNLDYITTSNSYIRIFE